jgi:hypothetical protein
MRSFKIYNCFMEQQRIESNFNWEKQRILWKKYIF